jgi:Ni,Fe-hydrogenase III large subunit
MVAGPASSIDTWLAQLAPVSGAPGARRFPVTPESWRPTVTELAGAQFRLLALWAGGTQPATVHGTFLRGHSILRLDLQLPHGVAEYEGIGDLFPAAARMQRAIRDLNGIAATGGEARPWLRHAAWPSGWHPLTAGAAAPPAAPPAVADDYAFVRVAGDGVHEIAVGPVHAGIIEPGHFRFSVVGEKVLRLEQRLGYVHKGIERRFAGMPLLAGQRLAARVSGDSAVAYSWAYVQALEGMAAAVVPPRAAWLRALALESERIANHLGDLGALGNDAGFAFGLAQFARLKELWLRGLEKCLAQRYLLDFVVPGGVARDATPAALAGLAAGARLIAAEAARIGSIYDEHAGVRDRFVGTGSVPPELAQGLGMIGLAARASGQHFDLRADAPCEPYTVLAPRVVSLPDGDVAARVAVRFGELAESARLIERIATQIPPGPHRVEVAPPGAGQEGIGAIEGWRGPVMVALSAAADGVIGRCHPHDPSWQNWPLLEHAVIGNIVPDFPLINKSFNLSYSGHDL